MGGKVAAEERLRRRQTISASLPPSALTARNQQRFSLRKALGPMTDLPPLRDVIARHGLSASKALGQNFLFDEQLLDRIAAIPGDLAGKQVLEVGPGPGGLTRWLRGGSGRWPRGCHHPAG